MSDSTFECLVIILLILVNGLFSMAEMALVTARKSRLEARARQGHRGARLALGLLARPDRLLSTVQIGITLVGILTGAFGGAALTQGLDALLQGVPLPASVSQPLALGLVVLGITFLTLVLGELVPKRLAFAHPERLAGLAAPPMALLAAVASPAVGLLSWSTSSVLRLLGVPAEAAQPVTEDDIRALIAEGARLGVVEPPARQMLERVFRLADRTVDTTMTHRTDIVWLDLDAPWEENLRRIAENPFSRFPVARGDLAEPVGVVKAREVLLHGAAPDLQQLAHPALFVPETQTALGLLEMFKRQPRMHFAFVVDEYGGVEGIVTLNDILEAIVGDLPQEGQAPDDSVVRRADGSWLLDGDLPMQEVAELLELRAEDFPDGAYKTLAGFILTRLGRIPATGEQVAWQGWRFEVVDMDGRQIDRVLVARAAADERGGA